MRTNFIKSAITGVPRTSMDKFGTDPRFVPGTPQYEAEFKAVKEIQNSAAAVPVAVETPAPVQTVETWRGINKKWIYFAAGAVAFWLLWGRR